MPQTKTPATPVEMPKVGDHPVLDFLNTIIRVDGELVDLLESDADVRRWLARAGWPVDASAAAKLKPTDLLETARAYARRLLARDPELTSPRCEAVRTLLYLFMRDDAVRLLRAG